jgi:beta-xylosidase
MKPSITLITLFFSFSCFSQKHGISRVWVADNGNGTYKNPILHADYSDPDAIRVGNDYYMTASSFEDVPGLPVLHSKDLVNWEIIGHALKQLIPHDHFLIPRHGEGVWAPSIRYHHGEFYIYYPDPDFGIYLVKARNAAGPWSEPILVQEGKGLIDPCPLWDDDGQAYLVHAFAGSRAGIKSLLVLKKMNAEGTKIIDEGVVIYDGHETDPTVEGPKFYKRNGYYYILAPAGGVATGWQLALRSKNIEGPYERKVVMDQGKTSVNGPHQGAWVTTQTGEDWFLHFQDKGLYGRVVHLQPVTWVHDWPVIGEDSDGDGKGEPVMNYKKPDVGKTFPIQTPAESDEFNGRLLGLQWQWMANPQPGWFFMDTSKGVLRLFSSQLPDPASGATKNLWAAPNLLLQKLPAEDFTATAKISFHPNPKMENEKAGMAVMGMSYANLALKAERDGVYLVYTVCTDADKGSAEKETLITKLDSGNLFLKLTLLQGNCQFSYSPDGKTFINAGEKFMAASGKWTGAKMGLFSTREAVSNDSGWMDIDWFRVEPVAVVAPER